jgi:hypothetical protein
MVPLSQISTREPSPNFTEPVMLLSSSVNADRTPVMWLLAPKSKYHLCSTVLPSAPRCT